MSDHIVPELSRRTIQLAIAIRGQLSDKLQSGRSEALQVRLAVLVELMLAGCIALFTGELSQARGGSDRMATFGTSHCRAFAA